MRVSPWSACSLTYRYIRWRARQSLKPLVLGRAWASRSWQPPGSSSELPGAPSRADREWMSLPAKRRGQAASQRRGEGLPQKRRGQLAAADAQLSVLPPNAEAEWSGLSLQGLQDVTVRRLGAGELRKLALALLAQWRRDVEVWTAALSDLRGGSRRTQYIKAAEAEHVEAEHAVRVAEQAGEPPELLQALREDTARKRRIVSQARDPSCSSMYTEDFGDEKISITQALALLADGTMTPETLVYSDDAGFPFEGWTAWSRCSHCFVVEASSLDATGWRGSGSTAVVSTFYYSVDGAQPSNELPVGELPQLVKRGVVSADTLIFSDDPCFGSDEWVPWSECCSKFGHSLSAYGTDAKHWLARIHAERERGDAAAKRLVEVERLANVAASAAAAEAQATEEKLAQVESELLDAKGALSVALATEAMPENLLAQLRQDVVAKEAVAIAVRSLIEDRAEALQEAEATADFAANAAVASAHTTHDDGSPRSPRSRHSHSGIALTAGRTPIDAEVSDEQHEQELTNAVRLARVFVRVHILATHSCWWWQECWQATSLVFTAPIHSPNLWMNCRRLSW